MVWAWGSRAIQMAAGTVSITVCRSARNSALSRTFSSSLREASISSVMSILMPLTRSAVPWGENQSRERLSIHRTPLLEWMIR